MSRRRGLPVTARMRHDAHFVEELASEQTDAVGIMLPIDQLRPNPNQPRQEIHDLDELVASVEQVGVLEPLLVRRFEHGYQIVSGERRYRAAREAGLDRLPCIVLDVDDARALQIALIENLQRQDLSPFEEAEGLRALVEQFGLTHEEVAERISKSRSSVTETLTVAAMPRAVKQVLEAADVRTKSLILEVARCDSEPDMLRLANKVVEEGLTRDDLRELRRAESESDTAPEEQEADKPARSAPEPPKRVTFRSRNGITVTVYLSSADVTLADVERSLLEAIRNLRSNGIPN